jgi:hypothetical protein
MSTISPSLLVSEANAEAINSRLTQVNGRAGSFTMRNWTGIRRAAEEAEAVISLLPAHARIGARARYLPAGPPKSYRYQVASTEIEIVREREGWHVVKVGRAAVFPGNNRKLHVTLTVAQSEAAKRIRRKNTPPRNVRFTELEDGCSAHERLALKAEIKAILEPEAV